MPQPVIAVSITDTTTQFQIGPVTPGLDADNDEGSFAGAVTAESSDTSMLTVSPLTQDSGGNPLVNTFLATKVPGGADGKVTVDVSDGSSVQPIEVTIGGGVALSINVPVGPVT
jgi:hypothetical protein